MCLNESIKSGVGEALANENTTLTLDNLKPLIDKWAKVMRNTMKENL